MINPKELTAEDKEIISKIADDIADVTDYSICLKVRNSTVFPIRIGEEMYKQNIKGSDWHYFFSEIMVLWALQQFFESPYTRKKLAYDSYIYDENETFTEQFVVDDVLGRARTKSGRKKKSSIIELEMSPMPWVGSGNRVYIGKNKTTHLPFKVRAIRLVAA